MKPSNREGLVEVERQECATVARAREAKEATSLGSTFRDPTTHKRVDSLDPSNIDTNRLSAFLDQDQAFIF